MKVQKIKTAEKPGARHTQKNSNPAEKPGCFAVPPILPGACNAIGFYRQISDSWRKNYGQKKRQGKCDYIFPDQIHNGLHIIFDHAVDNCIQVFFRLEIQQLIDFGNIWQAPLHIFKPRTVSPVIG
jgi:hypothetical protein